MDPIKRGASRWSRFYHAKQGQLRPEQLQGRTVGSFLAEARTTSVRKLIEDTVVAFVPPVLPILLMGQSAVQMPSPR